MSATVTANDNISFDYSFVPLSDLQVVTELDKRSGRNRVKHVLVQDEPIQPTERFWNSLFARYQFNSAYFNYFSYDEVFNRISEKNANDRMRLCIERGDKNNRLLAVSHPNKALVNFNDVSDLISRYGGENVTYSNGAVESVHRPRNGGGNFNMGGDLFENRFVLNCPIDGYGAPNVYLSLLRLICSNGLVGYSRVFRSSLSLGKGNEDVTPSLARVLDGFGNEEGYAALRQRIEASQNSWASIYEANNLQRLLYKLHTGREVDDVGGRALPKGTSIAEYYAKSRDNSTPYLTNGEDMAEFNAPIFRAFEQMTGNPMRLYGIANMDALSAKRQRTLPVRCTIYDCINFATEVATHYSDPNASRKIQAWVGETVSNEYDMENTRDRFTDFKDFHLDAKLTNRLTGSEHADPEVN